VILNLQSPPRLKSRNAALSLAYGAAIGQMVSKQPP